MESTRPAPVSPLVDVLFEDDRVGRCLVAPDGSVLRANREWLRSNGFSLDQVIGANVVELFPESRDLSLALHARARAGHAVQVPPHAQTIGGRETWWEGSIAPVPLDGGIGLLITARQTLPSGGEASGSLDRALRRERDFTAALLDTVAALVVVLDLDGNVVRFNRACEAATGYAAAEVLGRSVFDVFIPHEELPGVRRTFERLRAGELPSRYQNRWRLKDGTRRLFAWENTYVTDGNGRAELVIATGTEVEGSEGTLHDPAALLRAISDTSSDVIFAKDRDGRLRFANPATLALIGKPLGDVLGKTDLELLADSGAARRVMENDARIMASGVASELEEHVPLPDGTTRTWLSRKMPYRDARGEVVGLLGISRDITDRKRTEQALRDNQQLLRSTLDHIPSVLAYKDREGRFVDVNWAVEKALGLPRERILGRRIHDFVPKDAAEVLHAHDLEVMATRRAMQREEVTPLATGTLYHVNINFPLIDGEGRVYGTGHISHDVTELKRAELALRAANEKLLENDRRKDEFLGMLSHELRNPLAPIRNALYILERAEPSGAQAHRAREVATRQVAQLTRLVDDLLDVTRIARGKIQLRRADLDLAALARRTAEDHRPVMQERGLALAVDAPSRPVLVNGDETRLAQVLGNLLSNAAKFTPAGGRVTLAVAAERGVAVLRVRDTGSGIEPDMLEAIFEPFTQAEQTLARSEGGLGLGLALVKGLVHLHGGDVAATSGGAGQGTQFVVTLPLAAPAPVAAGGGSGDRAPGPGLRRRVLVVDDNRDAAETLAELVELLGHDAEVAYDGPSAVAMALARPPDVVLCDLGLPGLDGYAVARELRAAGARAVRLFAVSGYAQPEDVALAKAAGFDGHLAKPPDASEIERILDDVAPGALTP